MSEEDGSSDFEIPSDYDGDPDLYQELMRAREDTPNQPKPKAVFPWQMTTSFWKDIPRSYLHLLGDYLATKELLCLSTVSKAWSEELDDTLFWRKRYIAHLGIERYKNCRMLGSTTSDNGWTDKQHLMWTIVSMETDRADQFSRQRDVWVGIMKERKRKFMVVYMKEQKEKRAEERVKQKAEHLRRKAAHALKEAAKKAARAASSKDGSGSSGGQKRRGSVTQSQSRKQIKPDKRELTRERSGSSSGNGPKRSNSSSSLPSHLHLVKK